MINSTFLTWAGIGVLGAFGFLAGAGGEDVRQAIWAEKASPTYSMSLIKLVYEDGKFGQQFKINSDGPVHASWAAEIVRDGSQLCSGGGYAPYEPRKTEEPDWYTPDAWTGGTCPALVAGDVARGVWTYLTKYGYRTTIHGVVIIE